MALMTTRFYSETLQLDTTVNIIIPDKLQKDHPLAVLYLLHGLSDDSSTWLMHSSVLRYAENRPFLIIMPDVHRSFYTDMAFGNHYWTYLTKELPKKIKGWFPVESVRSRTFAAGLSMGGYGVLKWGLNEPEKFSEIFSMSGAVDVRGMLDRKPEMMHDFRTVFGDPEKWEHSINDLFSLVDKVAGTSGPKPVIHQYCGTADFMYQDNLKFKAKLDESTLPHTYDEKPDVGHEWRYWDELIQRVLDHIEKKITE
ncbi:alpha/beta hydrolase family protein [Sporolactobacillus sp. THM19-2]|jgi:putative lysine transport system ATP-binding protein|uniref:alpha/beta hydrolase n=1 Tax=Sporolactobacillus sp. THM19-2 TaxID=2511171 RepID=UPI00101EF805|nr:alpha/beta hydrolase family protein [Sporolactobacillus sp. THM19-2]RYL89253.1 esterase family protein [Sporolactobacillus sp. THM19-2]